MQKSHFPLRSLVLLGVLIATGVFLRSFILAAPAFEVVTQPTEKSSYLLGESVVISGYAEFEEADPADAAVTLVIDGPRSATQTLPVIPGTYSYPDNYLEVTVGSVAVTSTGGTLPGGPGTRVEYDVQWSPPAFLDPPPAYNLVPNTTLAFPIPLATPTAVPGGEGLVDLPGSVEKFPIPLVGTPAPGQPNALPSAELAFAVPVVPTPTPEAGAADPLPAVTAAFPIPLAPTPVPEQGAPPDLPTLTEAFDVPVAATPTPEAGAATALDQSITEVFSIPVAPTPSAVPGVGELASTTEAFSIPNPESTEGGRRVSVLRRQEGAPVLLG